MKRHALATFAAIIFLPSLGFAQQNVSRPGESSGSHNAATSPEATSSRSIGLHLPTHKGSIMIGSNLVLGDIGFGDDGGGLQGYYDFSLTPRAGYFVVDNLAIGLSADGHFQGSGRFHGESYGLSGFARYYFGKAAAKDGAMRKTRFFLEAGTGFGIGSAVFTNIDGIKEKVRASNASFYLMPGVNHFISKNVAVEGGLNLNHYYYMNNTVGNSTHLGFNLGLQFFLGKR